MQELTIQDQHKQPVLHRTQITARVSFMNVVPSRLEVRKMLAGKMNAKEDNIIVHQILPSFGTGIAIVKADVYDKADVMPKLVDKYTMVRHLGKEEQAKVKDEAKAAKQAAKAAKQAAKKK